MTLHSPEDFPIARELHEGSDRSVGLVAAAYLDERLKARLQGLLLIEKNAKDVLARMFKPSGPIGPFFNRVDLGYLLRLYSWETREDMRHIAEIRNKLAHFAGAVDFSDSEIREKCEKLTTCERVWKMPGLPEDFGRPALPRPFKQPAARKQYIDTIAAISNILIQQTEGKAPGTVIVEGLAGLGRIWPI
jgi:hypothetical protein